MRDWYVAMRQAVDLTAKCQYCGSTFLFQNASCKCPFCKKGREEERAKVIAAIITDYFNVDSIVNSVNDEIDLFNEEGGYEVEPVSMDLLNIKNTVGIKIIYNGEYTIRNLMSRSIRISTENSDYGEIKPNGSKRLNSINNIILTMSVLRGNAEDYIGDEEFTTDDIMHLRERRIQFVLL